MLPIPILTMPTTIPAVAVASATVSMLREPSIKPLPIRRTVSFTDVRIELFVRQAFSIERKRCTRARVTMALKAESFGLWRITISS